MNLIRGVTYAPGAAPVGGAPGIPLLKMDLEQKSYPTAIA